MLSLSHHWKPRYSLKRSYKLSTLCFVAFGITFRYEHPLWGFAHCGIFTAGNLNAQTNCVKEQFYIWAVCSQKDCTDWTFVRESRYKKQTPSNGGRDWRDFTILRANALPRRYSNKFRYSNPPLLASRCKNIKIFLTLYFYTLCFIIF